MKSNIEYLRESLSPKNEWIDAIEREIKDKDKIIADLRQEVKAYELVDDIDLEEIDCGIGSIFYKTDNLKLQCLMDDFKEQHERSKQTLQLFQN